MELNSGAHEQAPPPLLTAAAYQRRYGRTTMVLTHLRGATPEKDELCRILSVGTLAPSLWVTVKFLDGTTKSFRSETIRPASKAEEQVSLAFLEADGSSL